MPDFNVIGNVGYNTGPSGLFMALDPAYQAKQQQVQQNQLALNQAQLFKDGLPQDGQGNTDWNAAYQKAMSAGAYDLANNLVSTGIRMRSLNDSSTFDNPRGGSSSGGGQASGSGVLASLAPQRLADGSMIAPAAGGDDFGRAPGNGYAGVGQIGAGGIGMPASSSPVLTGSSGPSSANPPTLRGANPDVVDYIRSAATARGINPNVALAVSATEGLNGFDPNGNANLGDGGSSAGPYQLHYGNVATGGNAVGGMGDDFTKATGLDARDPSTWKQQVNFALDHAAQNGWGAWHGAQKAKIGNWAGIGDQPQGQATPASAPASGGQGGLISFGGPTAQSPYPAATAQSRVAAQSDTDLSTLTPTQNAQRDADVDAATAIGGGTVTDSQVMQARGLIRATSGYAPESLAPQARQALAAAQDTVARYGQQQAQSAEATGTVAGAPVSLSDDTPTTGQHPYAPTPAPTGRGGTLQPGSLAGAAAPAPQAGGFQPVSFGGPTAGGTPPALAPAQPMLGRQPPQVSPAVQPGVGQPISFNGGAPQGAPTSPAGVTPGNMPPEVGAALQRLQSRQGSPADAQLWGAYQRSMSQGGAPTASGAPPQVGQNTAFASGPDIPNLPAGYQDPGGGARYVNDVLAKASQFATAGDPRAKVWEARANQIQAQITAAQGFKNNLALAQARADDRYAAANSPGAIAAAGAKAGAETTARNALSLVPSVQPDGSTIMIPQSDALASAQAGKPIVSAQPGYVTTGQGNLLAKLSTGSQAYQERQVASQRLDALSSLLETYQTGANSTAFNEAAAQARSLGISVPASATLNPAAMQEFTKDGYANVLSSMKEQGNKQYAAEVQAAVNSNPNPDLQPEANAAMIAQMQGTKRWYDQNFRDYSQWYHGNKGASDDADFQTSWTDAHPLGAYVAAAGKDIAPIGIQQPAPGKLVDGQAYQTAGGKMRWSASAGRMVPFGGPTTPSLPGQGQNGSTPPVQGARQARDGNWYVPNPSAPGKYLMVSR